MMRSFLVTVTVSVQTSRVTTPEFVSQLIETEMETRLRATPLYDSPDHVDVVVARRVLISKVRSIGPDDRV